MLNFFKYRNLRRIRKRISGHYFFLKNNKFPFAHNLRRTLINLECKFENFKFSKFIFHNDFKEAKLALNQNIKTFFININAAVSSRAFDEAIKGYFANQKYKPSFDIIMPYQHLCFLKRTEYKYVKKSLVFNMAFIPY